MVVHNIVLNHGWIVHCQHPMSHFLNWRNSGVRRIFSRVVFYNWMQHVMPLQPWKSRWVGGLRHFISLPKQIWSQRGCWTPLIPPPPPPRVRACEEQQKVVYSSLIASWVFSSPRHKLLYQYFNCLHVGMQAFFRSGHKWIYQPLN